jgi:hypothetical protein
MVRVTFQKSNFSLAVRIRHLLRSSGTSPLVWMTLFYLWCSPSPLFAQAQEAPLPTAEYLIELENLARKCDELNMPAEAERTRTWWPKTRIDQTWLVFPNAAELSVASSDQDLVSKWLARFESLRRRHALFLLEEIQKSLDNKDEITAYRWVWRAYREDPKNKQLTFVLQSFLTATDIDSKVRLATTAHPKYNWPAKSYHRVQLPHFRIVSNTSAELLENWTQELERIFSVWTQAYPDLWLAPGALKNRLAGKNVPLERKAEMNVVLFRSRDDYLQQLGKSEQFIESSVGYYSPKDTTSFFYVEDNTVAYPTLVHELTHQILQEASLLRGSEPWQTESDFWIVEAIALHAESLWIGKEIATVGGWESPRLQVARYRMLREDYWLDWESLRSHSAESWKQQEQLARAYTQAAGLAHLWLDQADPAKREAFFRYLTSVYRNKPNPKLLHDIIPEEKLKQNYEEMLQVSAQCLEQLLRSRQLEECVLIGCELPKNGIAFLGSQTSMKWLDLSFMPLMDSHCQTLAALTTLERLSLESTSISSDGLLHLANLSKLTELDLSDTKVDDQAVALIAKLPALETLWLTETQITDQGLIALEKMNSLKFVQVDGSRITKDGWKAFLQKRPDLAPQQP